MMGGGKAEGGGLQTSSTMEGENYEKHERRESRHDGGERRGPPSPDVGTWSRRSPPEDER